jgi:hypothetical protein
MVHRKLKPGDLVIYRMTKHSTRPGPRAKLIDPAPHGEQYSYVVDKFWIVAEPRDDNKVLLRTRRGKEHVVDASNSNLRVARWWERLLYGHRFPSLESPAGDGQGASV